MSEINKEYTCPHCGHDVEIPITVEAHDEFWLEDDKCPHCGQTIPEADQYKMLEEAVINFISERIDRAMDYNRER
jgi:predicted RNA-binding Zn-ribbon protein involved in translation (DUF1610 family)